ncbi:MAG: hypothetical protein ACT4QG_21175 [Sporichthyaceae bacterium]
MKRTGLAALLALTLGLAGCGGGSDSTPAKSEQPAPAPSRTAPTTVTVQGERPTLDPTSPNTSGGSTTPASAVPSAAPAGGADNATPAKAGLLIASDLPGFTATDLFYDGSENFAEIGLYQCLRISGPRYTVREPGKRWTKGDRIVESTSAIVAKPADLKTKFTASKTANAQSCYTESLLRLVDSPGAITSGGSSPAVAKVKGADDSFAVEFTVRAQAGGTKKELTGFLVGAYVGTVEIFVISAAPGAGPKLAETTELAAKAAARARAALKK